MEHHPACFPDGDNVTACHPGCPVRRRVEQSMASTRDWTEDARHECGKHLNRCLVCGDTFVGNKRRVICYTCAQGGRDETGA